MSTAVDVVTARVNLAAAVTAAETQRRNEAKAQIEELRRRGAALTDTLLPLAAKVKRGETLRLALHDKLVEANAQIGIYSEPLDPMDLPTDVDVAEHAQQLTLWQRRQKGLLVEMEKARALESGRKEAIEMNAAIIQIRYAIRNLEAVSEGRKPGELPPGGVSNVTEDFVSIPSPGPCRAKRLAHE